MNVLITGIHDFIGQNLAVRLAERPSMVVSGLGQDAPRHALAAAVASADVICHLAGVSRSEDAAEFARVNTGLTETICAMARATGRRTPILFESSTHATRETPYGLSKRAAEQVLLAYADRTGGSVHLFRLPNVFGKWCRPNYNSAVATFCHNVARDLPIRIDDPEAPLALVHVDDVVDAFLGLIEGGASMGPYPEVGPEYLTTVGAVAEEIRSFRASRQTLITARVGAGLTRALYSTYVSYLRPEDFAYAVPRHVDPRGAFVEILKTRESGQFSFFTAPPGETRGGHYHHTKTEKFLVIAGTARFRFRHIVTGDRHEIVTSSDRPEIVETAPGWAHEVTNIGNGEIIVMLWANEIFDRAHPDTYPSSL